MKLLNTLREGNLRDWGASYWEQSSPTKRKAIATSLIGLAALAERHELLDDRTQVLGLRKGRGDLLVLDDSLAHICEHNLHFHQISFLVQLD